MARRSNKQRASAPAVASLAPLSNDSGLSFANPTEFVELPTKGRLYPPEHPFHMREEVEIRYMTAKDEDVLSSRTLIAKGVALDRFLQNILVDEIDVSTLYSGDKNALFIAARVTGYGSDYEVEVNCPSCKASSDHVFDLEDISFKEIPEDINITPRGTFTVELPKTGFVAEVKILNTKDQNYLVKYAETRKNNNLKESPTTDLLKMIIVSVNSESNRSKIESFIENMPALDSLEIRKTYGRAVPNVDLKQDFECSSCGTTTALEVPLGVTFFWPR